MRTDIIDSAKAIDIAAWDDLAVRAGTVYTGSHWLAFGETVEPDLVARHVQVRDHSGRLRAAVPAYVVGRPANAHYSADRLFEDVQRGTDDSPHLLVGGSRGYNGALLADPEDPELNRVVASVLEALAGLEDGLGPDGWSLWAYVPTDTARLLSDQYRTTARLVAGDCWIAWPGSGWKGYLGTLPSRRRVTIRRERAKFAAAGLRVVERPLADCLPEVGALIARTQCRYGFEVTPEGMTDLMRVQSDAFHGTGVAQLCVDEAERVLGCAVFYDAGGTRYVRAAGFDYEALLGAHEYFELCIYSAIEAASRMGLDRLHLGMSSYDAKTLRGARVSPRWMVSSRPVWGDAEARAANRRTAGEILAQVPAIERALVPGDDCWTSGALSAEQDRAGLS